VSLVGKIEILVDEKEKKNRKPLWEAGSRRHAKPPNLAAGTKLETAEKERGEESSKHVCSRCVEWKKKGDRHKVWCGKVAVTQKEKEGEGRYHTAIILYAEQKKGFRQLSFPKRKGRNRSRSGEGKGPTSENLCPPRLASRKKCARGRSFSCRESGKRLIGASPRRCREGKGRNLDFAAIKKKTFNVGEKR